MKPARKLLQRLALVTQRTPEESWLGYTLSGVRAKYFLFTVAVLSLSTIFAPILLQESLFGPEVRPLGEIPAREWRVLYAPPPGNCETPASDPNCPANPGNPALWESPSRRIAQDHAAKVRSLRGGDFWLGAVYPVEYLLEMGRREANQLVLGWIRASYRIWIDGEAYLGGTPSEIEPIILTIPLERLRQPKALKIAIRIQQNDLYPIPDALNGSLHEGFTTNARASAYRAFVAFRGKTRPFSFFLANGLIAALFLLFWIGARERQEYFFIGVYALLSAISQLRLIDIVHASLGPDLVYSVDSAIKVTEGALGVFVGLSFARSGAIILEWGLPLYVGLPILLFSQLSGVASRLYLNQVLGFWIVPALQLWGAAACILKAGRLYSVRHTRLHLPARIRRLLLFGVGLVALGALCFAQAASISLFILYMFWHALAHFGVVLLLGALVLAEYRERELLVERTPVSEYHRRPALPERLRGAILVADLKASWPYFHYRSTHGFPENLAGIWRSQFYSSVLKNDGTILFKRTGEVTCFFDSLKCPSPVQSALNSAKDMAHVAELILREFPDSGGNHPPEAAAIRFHATLTLGEIKPAWDDHDGTQEPCWLHANGSSPFEESDWMLELVRRLAMTQPTLVIMPQEIAKATVEQNPWLDPDFLVQNQQETDQAGAPRCIAIYRPTGSNISLDF